MPCGRVPRLHLLIRHNGADGIERSENTESAIIVERNVAILRRRIAPRDNERGEALLREITDERVRVGQIEDIIFHDPRRHDENRFRADLGRRR
jgi:hypothetical protein